MTGRHPPLRYPSSSRGEASAPVTLALAALFLVGVMAVLALIYVRRSMEQRAQAESARMEAERRRQIELQKAYETQMA
ncbi:MAG: hypothetical protein HYY93_11435, partial [Planctomycetes bacterium]|nr:hypothetical protein [Planctomycetota bacterium]